VSVETDVAEIKRDVKNLCNRFDDQIKIQKAFCEIKHELITKHIEEGKLFRDMVNRHGSIIPIITTIVILMVSGIITALIFVLRAKLMGIG
jgi:hypothetical protein